MLYSKTKKEEVNDDVLGEDSMIDGYFVGIDVEARRIVHMLKLFSTAPPYVTLKNGMKEIAIFYVCEAVEVRARVVAFLVPRYH